MGYNKMFELSLDDMELIETALRHKQKALSGEAEPPKTWEEEKDERLRKTHDLLGRLHNQKTFYRPKTGAYVSG